MNNRISLTILILILFGVPPVLATGINVYFDDNAIRSWSGSPFSDSAYHPYQTKLEFFHNSLPGPNSSAGKISVNPAIQYTHIGSQHKYQLSTLEGGTLYVRVWDDSAPMPEAVGAQSRYYGITSNPVASRTTLPYDWTISNLLTTFEANRPLFPEISFSESLNRIGATASSEIVLTVRIIPASSRIQLEGHSEGTYALRIHKSSDFSASYTTISNLAAGLVTINGPSLINQNSGAFVIRSPNYFQAGVTYEVIAWNRNWFSTASNIASTIRTWQLLGAAGISDRQTFTLTFEAGETGKWGLNFFAMPFPGPWYASDEADTELGTITNAYELVTAINKSAGSPSSPINVVSTFGRWDKTPSSQRDAGVRIPDRDPDSVTAQLSGITLEAGEGYQVYIARDSSVTYPIRLKIKNR